MYSNKNTPSTDKAGSGESRHALSSNRNEKMVFVAIVVLATLLRFYQLGSQMWLDEYNAIMQNIRKPWLEIILVYPGSAAHVLFELLANWSSAIFGESSWSVRLPAALSGIAGVIILAKLGARIGTMKSGLFSAALMAVSYHHVFFSQNARGYTLLVFFFLLSSYLFLCIAENGKMDRKAGIAYCIVTILTCYCQPFGVFIPASHFIVALCLAIPAISNKRSINFPIIPFTCWMIAAALFTGLLYFPLVSGMLEHARMNVATPEEGSRLSMALVHEIVEGLRAAFHGYIGLTVASIAGVVGVMVWLRCNSVSFFVLTLPIIVQALVFIVAGVGIHPRYFFIAVPVIYVAGGLAFYNITGYILNSFISNQAKRKLCHLMLLGSVVLVSVYPLIRYYSLPKQDFEGTLELVESLAKPGDIKVGVQSVGGIMTNYYGSNFIRIDTYEELLKLEQEEQRIWVAMTLERIMMIADPELVGHIRKEYELIRSFPGTIGNGSIQVYGQPDL